MVELLMALLILAEIATFTIPKVLQSTGLSARYAKAQETLATVTDLTYSYTQQNSGCFPGGSLTCKFDLSTGAVQDGKSGESYDGSISYNQFEDYLDSHLNYVQKGACHGYACWTLPNGTTVELYALLKYTFRPNQYQLSALYVIYLDTSIAQVSANQYSYYGVDTDYARLHVYAHGGVYAGINNWRIGTGLGGYMPSASSIFDLKDHPGDTCTKVGGTNCGL
jgi:type II secretory pathway pseudopilin PulG